MTSYPKKDLVLYDAFTLTNTLAPGGLIMKIEDHTEVAFYMDYTPGGSGDTLRYQTEFSNDGTNWHSEPDEVDDGTVIKVTPRTREFVSLSAALQKVPVYSVGVGDLWLRLLVAETAAGGFGSLTVRARGVGQFK